MFVIGASLVLSGLSSFNIVNPGKFQLSIRAFTHYELWRLFTSFFYYGKYSFGTFLHTLVLFSSSKNLEMTGSAQYLYFIILMYIPSAAFGLFFKFAFISDTFFLALTYVVSRRNRESKIAIMGLPIQISASYIPFIFLAFGFDYARLLGICLGHIYYFFEDVYPKLPNSRNFRIFNSPMIFFKISDYLRL